MSLLSVSSFLDCHWQSTHSGRRQGPLFWNAASTAVPNAHLFGLIFILADARSTAGCLQLSFASVLGPFPPHLRYFSVSVFSLLASFYESFLVLRERRPTRPAPIALLFA